MDKDVYPTTRTYNKPIANTFYKLSKESDEL